MDRSNLSLSVASSSIFSFNGSHDSVGFQTQCVMLPFIGLLRRSDSWKSMHLGDLRSARLILLIRTRTALRIQLLEKPKTAETLLLNVHFSQPASCHHRGSGLSATLSFRCGRITRRPNVTRARVNFIPLKSLQIPLRIIQIHRPLNPFFHSDQTVPRVMLGRPRVKSRNTPA